MKFAIIPIFACLSSCASTISAITKQPIPTTPVVRVGGTVPFAVATTDVQRAEADPSRQYGLYDAGALATALGKDETSSSK